MFRKHILPAIIGIALAAIAVSLIPTLPVAGH